jgi:bacillithiol synthase
MEATCLRQTELPHTSRLFSDFLYHFDRVRKYYENDHARVEYPESRRAEVVAALRELNGPSEALDRLAQPGTTAVVTGQQVGLFSGPSYTVYKALTAVKLARQMTESGNPAVPVFWLATEDHDFAEVNHAWVYDGDSQPVRIEVSGPEVADHPVGGIRVESWHVDELRKAIAPFAFGDDVAVLVEQAYAPGRTMGEAFHALVAKLLERFGLIYLDPLHPAIRKVAAPILRKAISAGPELSALLLERNRQLTAEGYHTQVHVEPQTSLFFVLDGDRRVHLKRQNGDYVADQGRFPAAQLAETAENLSPTALLRPVVQDYLLPTAAYIGGPAELAYFAQSQVLYRQLIGGMPRLVPRSGFTLIDRRSTRLMDRYGLGLTDFFHGEDHLKSRISEKLVPPSLQEQFAQTNVTAVQMLDALQASVAQFDSTLGAAAAKSRAKILYQLSKIEGKVARESLRRNERAGEDACYIFRSLYPHKHLQERFYSILPFLARHGFNLLDTIYDNVHLDCPDHIVLTLDD